MVWTRHVQEDRTVRGHKAGRSLSRREFLAAGFAALAGGSISGCSPGMGRTAGGAVSLDEMIGQMILVGFRGLTLEKDNPLAADIREGRIGGVVLFDYDVPSQSPVRNIESPSQLKTLIASLQTLAGTPLFISVDQEGGKVSRLKEKFGFPATVSQKYLGTLNDPAVTRKHAAAEAAVLAEAGFNLNFAPVVDLDVNPDNPVIGKIERSFGADPDLVFRHAAEVIRAHRDAGVLTTLKHFPGHGSSKSDSHLGFTDVTETWSRVELEPYLRIIGAGLCDAVMTAHVFNAGLDPEFPATLSPPVIDGLLRGELDHDGVVVSDDMQMKAIAANFSLKEAVLRAVGAGVDILTFANNSVFDPGIARTAARILKEAVAEGAVSVGRIERSHERIVRLKTRIPSRL
jgi:beta-N-acetylhexosaminidase